MKIRLNVSRLLFVLLVFLLVYCLALRYHVKRTYSVNNSCVATATWSKEAKIVQLA